MKKNNTITYDLDLNIKQIRVLLVIVIILVSILLFKKKLNTFIEKIIVFSILFLLFLIISKNLVITFIGTCIIFLLFNMLMQYSNTIEKFQDLDKETSKIDLNILNDKKDDDKLKESKEGLSKLLKQMNGGIKLTENDLKETNDPIKLDIKKYSDDNTPNALKIAQKETYELMNTVSALKDTITTLAPVLQEGKKLMSMFENIKL
jgi:hypothetical protein